MGNYGATTSKTGGLGTAAISNDDSYTLDLPDVVDDSDKHYSEVKDSRSF